MKNCQIIINTFSEIIIYLLFTFSFLFNEPIQTLLFFSKHGVIVPSNTFLEV